MGGDIYNSQQIPLVLIATAAAVEVSQWMTVSFQRRRRRRTEDEYTISLPRNRPTRSAPSLPFYGILDLKIRLFWAFYSLPIRKPPPLPQPSNNRRSIGRGGSINIFHIHKWATDRLVDGGQATKYQEFLVEEEAFNNKWDQQLNRTWRMSIVCHNLRSNSFLSGQSGSKWCGGGVMLSRSTETLPTTDRSPSNPWGEASGWKRSLQWNVNEESKGVYLEYLLSGLAFIWFLVTAYKGGLH